MLRFGEDNWPYFVTGEYARLVQPMPFADCVQEPVTRFLRQFCRPESAPGMELELSVLECPS